MVDEANAGNDERSNLVWGRVDYVDGIVIVSEGDLEQAIVDRECADVICGATWDAIAQVRSTIGDRIGRLIDETLEDLLVIAWEDYSSEAEDQDADVEMPTGWYPPSSWAADDVPVTLDWWLDHHGGPNCADWVTLPDQIMDLGTRSQAMDGTNLIEFDERRLPEIETVANRLALRFRRDDLALKVFQY